MAYCYCLGCSQLLNFCTCKKGETMKQMTPKEAKRVIGTIRKLTAEYFANANKKYAVLGVSGGLDSAVVAGIMSGIKSIKTIGCILPCHSNALDERLADKVITKFKLQKERVCLDDVYQNTMSCLTTNLKNISDDRIRIAQGNVKARLRMIALYHIAQLTDGIVLGTGNYSEYLTGFTTLHGDAASDFDCIHRLWKSTEVVALAKALKVPAEIIKRPPTDGLTANGKDEDQLGLPYKELDPILELTQTKRFTRDIMEVSGRSEYVVKQVLNRVNNSEFKRNHPKVLTREELGL